MCAWCIDDSDGVRVVVADSGNNRLCVFSLDGMHVTDVDGFDAPYDVAETHVDGSLVVAEKGSKR